MYVCVYVYFVCSGCLSVCMSVSMCVMSVWMCVMYVCMCVVSDVMSWRGPAHVKPTWYHLPVWSHRWVWRWARGRTAEVIVKRVIGRCGERGCRYQCSSLININYSRGTVGLGFPRFPRARSTKRGQPIVSLRLPFCCFLHKTSRIGGQSSVSRLAAPSLVCHPFLCKSSFYLKREYIL